MKRKNVIIFGAGKQAQICAKELANNQLVGKLTIVDRDAAALDKLQRQIASTNVVIEPLDFSETAQIEFIIAKGTDLTISCAPYQFNAFIASAAIRYGSNYIDLGGSVGVRKQQQALDAIARGKNVIAIPDVGLAPGLTSILAKKLVEDFEGYDEIKDIKLRCGGLPANSNINTLKYFQSFSIAGLINEYFDRCEVLRNGAVGSLEGLAELETLKVDGFAHDFEAFCTSGGASTLPESYVGKVTNLDYKTIRYAGHHKYLSFLFELGFTNTNAEVGNVTPRQILESRLSKYLPTDQPDIVIITAEGTAIKDGKETTIGYQIVQANDKEKGYSAMQQMTVYPVLAIAELILKGEIKETGVQTQENFVPVSKVLQFLAGKGIELKAMGSHTPEKPATKKALAKTTKVLLGKSKKTTKVKTPKKPKK